MSVRPACVLLLCGAIAAPLAAAPQTPTPKTAGAQAPAKKTLYERLGGYDGIAKIVDAFPPHLLGSDPKIPPMFTGLADTSKMRNRQLIVDQLCNLTGGPCLYIGRSMEASHQGLEITEEMWKAQMKGWADTMDEVKLKDPEKTELLAVIDKLKDGIVQKKKDKG